MNSQQQSTPPDIYEQLRQDDVISLTDIWLAIVKHKRIFWGVFAAVLLSGLTITLFTPATYTVTSTLQIGHFLKDAEIVPFESPQTVKAKLDNVFIPNLLADLAAENQSLKFIVTNPANSMLITIQNKAGNDTVANIGVLQERLINSLIDDHKKIIDLYQSQIVTELRRAELSQQQLLDERLLEPQRKLLEAQLGSASGILTKLTSPVIQEFNKKALEIQLNREINKLATLQGEALLLNSKKERIEKERSLLETNILDLKQQVKDSLLLKERSISETRDGANAMALMMVDNQLQQNRDRLATLEQRLYIDLETQQLELQKGIENNTRLQTYQSELITQSRNNLEKYQIVNKLEREEQLAEITRIKAEMAKLTVDLEQKIGSGEQEIMEIESRLDDLIITQAVTAALRSPQPAGPSTKLVLITSMLLGIILGLLGVFLAAFLQKVRRQQSALSV